MTRRGRPPRSVALAVRVFGWITSVMPRRYRGRHRADALDLMERLAADAHLRRGVIGVIHVLIATLLDFVAWLPAHYVDRRHHQAYSTDVLMSGRFAAARDSFTRDLRHGWRTLVRRPGTTLVIVATLAIGIGLNAAIFAVVDWVLLRPLPHPAARQLVRVFTAGGGQPAGDVNVSATDFQSFARAQAFQVCTAISATTRIIAGTGLEPSHVSVARITGDLFSTFAVYPQIGRAFSHDEIAGGAPVIVVSDGLWRRRLAADPSAIGRTVTIDGAPHSILGVMPRLGGYPREADVWRPLTAAEREDDDRDLVMIGRLKAEGLADRASLELATLARGRTVGRTAWVEDLQQTQSRHVRLALTALFGSAALLLLIATANVAALVAARSAGRVGEIAIRGALGASRARIFQQIVTETALVGAAGGAAGLCLGQWVLGYVIASAPPELPRLGEIALDGRIVIAGSVTTLVIAVLVGVLPAYRASRLDLRTTLIGGSVRASGRTAGRPVLVAAQAALAVVLAVSAGLLGRSLHHLVTVDHGFAPTGLLAIGLDPVAGPADGRPRPFRELIDAASAMPGVQSAAIAWTPPTRIGSIATRVQLHGEAGSDRPTAVLRPITPTYFETVRIPLLSGRAFTEADRAMAARVAIVNSAFVRDIAHRDPVGLRLTVMRLDAEVSVVGVVADISPGSEPDRPAIYLPEEQMRIGQGSLLVRTSIDSRAAITALRARLQIVAPEFAFDRIEDVSAALAAGRASSRFTTQIASAFAGLALLLAAIGVYGLTTAEVASRWRDVAVRLALGASRTQAFWDVMRPGTRALTAGVAVGLVTAAAAARWITSLLHGVQPADPPVLVTVPLLLIITGLAAAALAARRMLHADPAEMLRKG